VKKNITKKKQGIFLSSTLKLDTEWSSYSPSQQEQQKNTQNKTAEICNFQCVSTIFLTQKSQKALSRLVFVAAGLLFSAATGV
jgi:hypothetical protein